MLSDFQKHVLLSSYPIKGFNRGAETPSASGSGLLCRHKNKLFLFTVAHNTSNNLRWAIELDYVPGKGAKLWCLSAPYFIDQIKLDNEDPVSEAIKVAEVSTIDACLFRVERDIEAFFQEYDQTELTPLGEKHKRLISDIDFNLKPKQDDQFAFSGQSEHEQYNNFKEIHIFAQTKIVEGLKFERDNEWQLEFKLPVKHQGHDFYKGVSGAPLINSSGGIVGLVTGGNTSDNTIYACPIKIFEYLIHFYSEATQQGN